MCLFLALALGFVALDWPRAYWSLWWIQPLALLSAGLGLYLEWHNPQNRHRLAPPSSRHLVWMLLLLGYAVLRLGTGLNGPKPFLVLREFYELSAIVLLAFAVWTAARTKPFTTLGTWFAALILGWSVAMVGGEAVLRFDSPSLILGISLIASGIMLPVAWLRRQDQINPLLSGASGRVMSVKRFAASFLVLILGVTLSWMLIRTHLTLPPQQALLYEHGIKAQKVLWLRSIVIGWGHVALEPLITIAAEPNPARMPAWSGPYGWLAQWGVSGGLVLLVWLTVLLRAMAHGRTLRLSQLLSGGVALLLLGMLTVGGARSGRVLMTAAVWTAIAVSGGQLRRAHVPMPQWAIVGLIGLVGVMNCLLTAIPISGSSMARKMQPVHLTLLEQRRILQTARDRNPWDPVIPMKLARVTREEMDRVRGWSESLYQETVGHYRQAIAVDPLDPMHAIRLAGFHLLCDREDAAIEVITRTALPARPFNPELVDWLYRVARRLDRSSLAYRMLDHALKNDPTRLEWWNRQHELARGLGQRSLQVQALSRALTANPDLPQLVKAYWASQAAETPGGSPSLEAPFLREAPLPGAAQ